MLQPFVEFLENYTVAYDVKNPEWGDIEITRTIVEMFYDSCVAHREALVGVAVAGHELDTDTLARLEEQFDRFFAEIMRTTSIEAHRRGWVPQEGLGLTMRLLFGAIASIVVFDRPLVPGGDAQPSRDHVIDHVTRLFLFGARLEKH